MTASNAPQLNGTADCRALTDGELAHVSGGVVWTPGTVNRDVVDARGGSWTVLGIRWTRDAKGNLTSIKFG